MTTATLVGSEVPRLWTRPKRELTPETSLGFECVRFSELVLGITLDPWQRWFLIHALELNPDGSFRFRTILLLVARQNGKTTVMRVLSLWAIFTGRVRLVVGTAQDLDVARESWSGAVDLVEEDPELAAEIAGGRPRRTNGQEELKLRNGCRYKIKATTENAGRGIPGVGLLLLDELRTHRDSRAWGALSKTTLAVPNALIVGMSNAGDDGSVVLNALREAALAGTDDTLALFEWSAPDGCALDDREAWAQANPSLGHGRLTERALESALATDPPAVYRTECLCQRVETIDAALDLQAWRECADRGSAIGRREDETDEAWTARRATIRVFAGLDVALDGSHASLVVASPTAEGRVRLEVAAAWRDVTAARDALPDLLGQIRPDVLAWFPSGPAAPLATLLADRRALPRRLKLEALKGERAAAACMGLADLVRARRVLHSSDDLLDAQVMGAAKLRSADGWRFTRNGSANVDAVYAAAGAAHFALMPSRGARWEGVVI